MLMALDALPALCRVLPPCLLMSLGSAGMCRRPVSHQAPCNAQPGALEGLVQDAQRHITPAPPLPHTPLCSRTGAVCLQDGSCTECWVCASTAPPLPPPPPRLGPFSTSPAGLSLAGQGKEAELPIQGWLLILAKHHLSPAAPSKVK